MTSHLSGGNLNLQKGISVNSKILVIFFLATFPFSELFANVCHQRLGSFDIGSGSSKAYAAEVDICKKKIRSVLFDKTTPIAFEEDLKKSKNNQLSHKIIEQAEKDLAPFLAEMKKLNLKMISGLATSTFRKANNGAEVIERLSKKLQISLFVIDQNQEAEIGYLSALSGVTSEADVIVWDIGGGSMQMITKVGNKTELYLGELASISFKNKVIQDLQKKDPQVISSPNPMGNQAKEAVALAKAAAEKEIPDVFKI